MQNHNSGNSPPPNHPPTGDGNEPLHSPSFFHPYAAIEQHEHHLPHWQQGEVWCFVTWRLTDSLPSEKLLRWQEERKGWLEQHPKPWEADTENEYQARFTHKIDLWLDQGCGACLLQQPRYAEVVAHALRYFDAQHYHLSAFVVMPNHVHVLFRPCAPHQLAGIIKGWKGYTAREINRRRRQTGPVWQADYWDRLIRNAAHFERCREYIQHNPVRARLPMGHFVSG